MNATLPLSPQVFAILSGLIEERTGIRYSEADRELLAERVSPRAIERGFDSLLDYYYCLRYDADAGAELALLVDSLVVNETYFFREADALRVVRDLVLAPQIEAGRRPRLWSAACSTGEEPLTQAMLLDAEGLLTRTELVASDISARALERARRGFYRGRALRALPDGVIGRWLFPEDDGVRAASRLLQAVDYRRVNLLDCAAVEALGTFDVILCRNALIYFGDERIKRVVATLSARLESNGCLVIGVAESLLRFDTALACQEHRGVFVYRKTEP
jgi:chemotaxis protein methyltransferase CheR